MRPLWRVYLVVACAALCWLSLPFVVLPRLGDPVSFNKVSNAVSPDVSKAPQTSNQVPPREFRGNVYHIIFDAYQSEAYQYFLDKTPELRQLPVTYYPNFRANSWITYWSVATLFSGNLYKPGMSPGSWRNTAFQSRGMMEYLGNSGVQIHVYTSFPDNCYARAADCHVVDDLKKELLGESQVIRMVRDMWFLKLIPTSLKRELNAQFAPPSITDGDSFSDWDYGFSISDAIAPTKIPDGGPYFALEQFKRFLDSEDSRPATGQYNFIHVLLPHQPFELDGECTYVGRKPDQARQENYLEHVRCTNKLMGLLVQKLASLGRLDNSLIIFQADHGYYWHPADLGVLYGYHPMDVSVPRVVDPERDDSSMWASEVIETRASALLLVKFPGQSVASRSDKPVEMIDVAPTILRYFDIHPDSMSGIPIQDMPEPFARERFFLASNYIPTRRNPRVFSKYHYVDGRWKFEENIETFTVPDQLFTIKPVR